METLRSIQECIREWNDADTEWQARMPVRYEVDDADSALVTRGDLFSNHVTDDRSVHFDAVEESLAPRMSASQLGMQSSVDWRQQQQHATHSDTRTSHSKYSQSNNTRALRHDQNTSFKAERRRPSSYPSRSEAVARAEHAVAVSSGSPLLRRLALARRREKQRRQMLARMEEFERESQRAARRNEQIRLGFSKHAQELEDRRIVDIQQAVDQVDDGEAEALRISLEKEKRKFLERMMQELGPHEDRLATWKVELVEKMERDAKMSQDRLMESRVAYEREKGVLELLSKRRAEVMVAEAYERQEAIARGLSRAELAKQEEVLLRSIDACSKEAISDIVAQHYSTQEERDSQFMHRCLADIEELRRELKTSTMKYVESLQRRS